MAITAKYFSGFFISALNKEIDLDSDVIKVSLHTSAMAPNQDTWRYRSSLTNEVSGSGYTAGGATMTGVAVSYNATTNVLSFTGNNVSWPAATLIGANAPRYAVLYDSSPGTDATRPLIGYIDFGSDDYAPNGGTLTIQWDAAGIGAVTVA
ncbi:hypothetical protein TPA4_27 [Tsukamurella phage TPA4]|uniref:hypothetical protein n=1 Tax=Tsukamurella phage TPA4 TaxID=1647476 RepID=UPI0007B6424F|nr:hypothetical protein BH784_gp27 [Tsukamurella phage TPA4]AKJ72192.1 hypothetical protein TPA4_27 [Tsukamurella phage TPA4]